MVRETVIVKLFVVVTEELKLKDGLAVLRVSLFVQLRLFVDEPEWVADEVTEYDTDDDPVPELEYVPVDVADALPVSDKLRLVVLVPVKLFEAVLDSDLD
eukprot:TRINITY_DN10261_c0_g1_i1.p3 TRINITY_DN10261_c0_g1~~TRINITY_DN10261_c0_g1_i1.p3  ORF type:complete len:100 (+),score=20.49 TRINITY_DN10261_c0_g1_i1:1953-2252(+)